MDGGLEFDAHHNVEIFLFLRELETWKSLRMQDELKFEDENLHGRAGRWLNQLGFPLSEDCTESF
jgi:hypothetical protein